MDEKLIRDGGYLVVIKNYFIRGLINEPQVQRMVIPNKNEVMKFLIMIQQTNEIVLEQLALIEDFVVYEDIKELVQGIIKPNNKSFGDTNDLDNI